MANLRKWSQTATGNASVAGGSNTINFAEGQSPGSVNNSARELMAQVRTQYTPSNWGWVEFSATSSVASQTTFKLTGNQTTDWAAGRRVRLKSGSTTRYASIVSSSFTTETTVTVTVDSGSLSASHSLAALSVIDTNHLPGAYVTSSSLAGAIANYVTSDSASKMIATQITASPPGVVLISYQTLANATSYLVSGSWTAYAAIEIQFGGMWQSGAATSKTVSVAIFTDGGTTQLASVNTAIVTGVGANGNHLVTKVLGVGTTTNKGLLLSSTNATVPTDQTTVSSAAVVNAVRVASSVTLSSGYMAVYGYRNS